MKKDHLSPDLRAKVNILRKHRVTICNDLPGGYLACIVATPDVDKGCGLVFTYDEFDKAIELCMSFQSKVISRKGNQLSLF